MTTDSSMKFPMKINPYDGWYPLLRVPALLKGQYNPYFNTRTNARINGRVYGKINVSGSSNAFRYKAGRKGVVTIYSGYSSAMGIAGGTSNLPSSIYGSVYHKMYGEPDIFCMGVVRPNTLPVIEISKRKHYMSRFADITYNPEDITIFVSIEKLRKAKFHKEKYTPTIRNEILFQINKLRIDGIKVEDVPEEYLQNFYTMPQGIKSSSIVEIMKMESEIKGQVFSNLNKIVA